MELPDIKPAFGVKLIMMATLSFTFCILLLFILYTVFGMTLLPASLRTAGKQTSAFLLSPLLGSAVWLVFSVLPFGILPFHRITLLVLGMFALPWCIYRRKTLFLPKEKTPYVISLVLMIFAVFISRIVYPFHINGGLYFNFAVYDHVRCALVNSLAEFGFPPVNPWLADNGIPVPLFYYFRWYAWTAQIPVITGIPAIWAECCMTGFSMLASTAGLAGIAGLLGLQQKKCGFVFLLFFMLLSLSSGAFISRTLPAGWLKAVAPEGFVGFWDTLNNFIWSPHHSYSGAVIVLISFFYTRLLDAEERKEKISFTILLALLASAAFFTSVYAGGFTFLYLAVSLIILAVFKEKFRSKILANWLPEMIAAIIFLVVTAGYLHYLASSHSEIFPLKFGIMNAYGKVSGPIAFLRYLFSLFCFVLPNNIGPAFIFGIAACFIPRALPDTDGMRLFRIFIAFSLCSITFVHSSFYSNDFGWRTLTPALHILIILSAFLAAFLFERFERKGPVWKVAGIALAGLLLGFELSLIPDFLKTAGIRKSYPELRVQFAKSVKGWDVVHQHTQTRDLVQCNPRSFYEIGMLYEVKECSTNVFFSLYSKRATAIGDLIFAKCYSEFYPQAKLEERYKRVCAIFDGNPSRAEIDYLADELKIKAVLVTPYDGMWNAPGAIRERYAAPIETNDYKVFLLIDPDIDNLTIYLKEGATAKAQNEQIGEHCK